MPVGLELVSERHFNFISIYVTSESEMINSIQVSIKQPPVSIFLYNKRTF